MKTLQQLLFCASLSMLPLALGCRGEDAADSESEPTVVDGPPPEIDDHSHSSHGPRGGELIDLGRSHLYHAEIVADKDAGHVSVYILDGKLEDFEVETKSVTLNLVVDGAPHSFELQAANDAGASAEFTSEETLLLDAIADHAYEECKLTAIIGGTPYSGHLHDHEH